MNFATKGQKKKLYNENPGYGWIVFSSGENEITEIEVYVGRDNVLRRVSNGRTLFPMQMTDSEEGLVFIQSGLIHQ